LCVFFFCLCVDKDREKREPRAHMDSKTLSEALVTLVEKQDGVLEVIYSQGA
jgi:hypothetical protein